MAFSLLLGAVFVAGCTWLITRLVGRRADRSAQADRDRRFRQLSPEAPRAAGIRHRRIG